MRLEQLRLENYRGFQQLALTFEPDITILVGVNGAGKSTILDAIALMLSSALYRAAGGKPRVLADLDVRSGCVSTWAEASVVMDDGEAPQSLTWSLAHARKGYKRARAEQRADMLAWADRVQQRRSAGPIAEPLAVYYPTERTVLDVPRRIRETHTFGPGDALALALEGRTVDFRLFFEWFREREDIENERRARESVAYRDPALNAVRDAIAAFMPGVRDPRVQRVPQRFVVTKGDLLLEVDQLSDGERSVLALVGDLARRLAMARSDNALAHPAIVLIDEIELHLHPGLQRDVIASLRRTFPAVQFILTTHSPFVLGEVDARCIRLLRNFSVELPSIETAGEPIGVISRAVQGVPARSPDIDALVGDAHAALDRTDLPTAETALDALRARVGAHDPEVIRLESLLDLLARD